MTSADAGEHVLGTGEVDYTFNGGHVGFYREEGATTNVQWDDFICGYDADADGHDRYVNHRGRSFRGVTSGSL